MKKVLAGLLTAMLLCLAWDYYFPLSLLLENDAIEAVAGNQTLLTGREVAADDIYAVFKDMEQAYSGPLPWEHDPQFQAAITGLNSPRLMAAYRATLAEPMPGEEYNIGLAAEKLCGTTVAAGEVFSQNKAVGPYTTNRGYRPGPTYKGTKITTTVGGGVCKIASVLYNVAIFSDLEIVRRYPHSMTVPYVPPGQDATVFYGVKDFQFKNTTDKPLLIWAQKVQNTLYIAIYGFASPPKVAWHHRVLKRFSFSKEYRYNPGLQDGEERMVLRGQEGLVVRSWVTVERGDGPAILKRRGVSYYSPSPEVVETKRKL
ncbi:MAG: VanW family protein [Negativicutes bacterium]|nr:VanW family protein [Negativicutes bacterium]